MAPNRAPAPPKLYDPWTGNTPGAATTGGALTSNRWLREARARLPVANARRRAVYVPGSRSGFHLAVSARPVRRMPSLRVAARVPSLASRSIRTRARAVRPAIL